MLGTIIAVGLIGGLVCVCFAKSRVLLGVVGIFIPLAALWGACRLGHPRSLWARWRYGEQKMTRAEHRFGEQRPLMRIGRRAEDLIAGAPSQPDPDP